MKILIIDDNADIRSIARLSLSRVGGMDVIEACSGREGVRKARAGKPDVILLDRMMPTMDGVATLAALRAQPATAKTPVIFLTAHAVGDEIEDLKALGAAGVLIKPFDPRTLAADVRALAVKKAPPRSPASATHALQPGLDQTRERFVATFVAQCNALRILVDRVAAGSPRGVRGPVVSLTRLIHELNGLAGTIGFPTVSARAADLEGLVRSVGRGAFDPRPAHRTLDAIGQAFAADLARRETLSKPAAVSVARATTQRVEGDESVPKTRILIVDDHAIVRRGLKALLSDEFRGATFGEAGDAQQALQQLRTHLWDVALLDITLPGKSGLDLLKELRAEWPRLPVLVLSGHVEDLFAVRVLKAGAGGYMTKASASEELAKAVRKVLAGGRYISPALAEKLALSVTHDLIRAPHETLSDREYDVMARIAAGKTVTEIGGDLSLSVKTISTYRSRVLEKLGVKNSAEIVQYAIHNGLVN